MSTAREQPCASRGLSLYRGRVGTHGLRAVPRGDTAREGGAGLRLGCPGRAPHREAAGPIPRTGRGSRCCCFLRPRDWSGSSAPVRKRESAREKFILCCERLDRASGDRHFGFGETEGHRKPPEPAWKHPDLPPAPELTAVTCRRPGLSSTPDIDRPPGPQPKSDHARVPPASTGGLGLVPGWAGASEVCTENGPFSNTGQCPAACRREQTDAVQPSWSSGRIREAWQRAQGHRPREAWTEANTQMRPAGPL